MGSGQRFVGSSVYSHIGLAIILPSTPHAPALLAKICCLAYALVFFASYSINNLSWSRAVKDYLFPPFHGIPPCSSLYLFPRSFSRGTKVLVRKCR